MTPLRTAVIAALLAAGCYSPSIPNGAQQCAPGGVCGDGYQCGPDNRCYQAGQLPGDGGVRDLSAARDAAGGDLAGADLAGGDRVVVGDQAMARDLVMACAGDPDCGGATPRCDVTVHLCVPCLPQNDNCAAGSFCTMVNGSWACQQGCKMDADCAGGGQPKCCANRCVDTLSDGANCGGCGTACGAQSCCAGACTDVTSNVANCGACGTVCSGKNANWTCTAKVCTVSSCSAPFANCNMQSGDGCEVNDGSDPSNCGSCGRTCSSNHVTASCGGGACNGACAGGFADCNGNKQTDGCETQVNGNDPSNCGGCGTVCSANHVTPQCSGGACTGACAGGYADCNGNKQADGCEINLTNDPGHCGACANICSSNHVTPTCGNSVCNGVCQAGFADCNGSKLTDGCETNIFTDPANCGGCGVPCNGGCVNGQCMGGCRTTVLVLSDGVAADQQLVALLQQNGLQPTLATMTAYAGAPDASGFGSVIVLAGVNYSTDMPAAGQMSIAGATGGGTGIVFFEWASYEASAIGNRFQTLKPLMAMIYASGTTSTSAPVYTQTVGHPVWTGLPMAFSFINVSEGLSVPALVNGGTAIATYSCTGCTAGTPAVAVRDTGVYRVVHDASSPNYGGDTAMWTNDANRMKLVVNMAKWAGHCL